MIDSVRTPFGPGTSVGGGAGSQPSLGSVVAFGSLPACWRQPWRFEVERSGLALRLQEPVDRVGRADSEVLVACGAALQNVRLALSHYGLRAAIQLLPDPEDGTLVAAVRPGRTSTRSAEDEALFAILRGRLLLRGLGRGRGVVSPALLALLRHAVRSEGAWVECVVDDARREALCSLLNGANGDGQHGPPGADTQRAARVHGLSLGDLLGGLGATVRTDVADCRQRPDALRDPLATAPVLAIVGTSGDLPLDWLVAGQALQRFLLHASVQGLATTFFPAPLEQSPLRDAIRGILAAPGEPQIVARLEFDLAGISLGAFQELGTRKS